MLTVAVPKRNKLPNIIVLTPKDGEKKLQRAHVKRLTKNKCTPEAGMIFSDTVSGLERVADHATNIAFAIMEPPVEEEDDEEEL